MQSHEPSEQSASGREAGIPAPGTIFDGRFEIERLIGKGGMGYVLAARHLELQQRVAIKLLSPGREQQERGSSRLLREARASARIRSEHVVRVLDVVQSHETPAYIVLEYLEGEDLAHRLSERTRLDAAEAVDIVLQACEAVGEGHRLGIVHRDLKPSNLFLCSRAGRKTTVKVLDFGISKMDEAGASLTQSYALLGSPIYAAPEQLRSSRDVDARADVWSLGVVLYECVTGARPFVGQTLAQVCTSILHDSPRSPRAMEPELPRALEDVLLRCLRRDPAERYQSIEAFVDALRAFAPDAAERCANYLDALPPAEETRTSSSVLPKPPRVESSDTLTGSAEYDSRDEDAGSVRPTPNRQLRGKLSLAFAALLLASLGAWQLLRNFGHAAAVDSGAHSAVEPPASVAFSPIASAPPSSSSVRGDADVNSPSASASASPERAPVSLPAASNRTAGPQRMPSRRVRQPIVPWVDTR